MKYKTGDIEEFDGVGRIWKQEDGWYFETIYGARGGPMERHHAVMQMDCQWATVHKDNVGIANGRKERVSPKQRDLWRAQEDLLRVAWR